MFTKTMVPRQLKVVEEGGRILKDQPLKETQDYSPSAELKSISHERTNYQDLIKIVQQ